MGWFSSCPLSRESEALSEWDGSVPVLSVESEEVIVRLCKQTESLWYSDQEPSSLSLVSSLYLTLYFCIQGFL
jgi:hypothetical protein